MQELLNGIMGVGQQLVTTDSSESVIISTIALIKMFKHASRGVPIEVMGLCIGRFIDEYTVYIQDVFAMPQVGQSDSVETVDEQFQSEMLQMLEHVGIHEKAVGWFHSHPGYYCWLSSVDQRQQETFEQMDPRCVAVVVDPVNSANGRLVIEAFRLIKGRMGGGLTLVRPTETRLVTAEAGFLRKREHKSVQRGMGSQFYQMCLQFNKLGYENVMIRKVAARLWPDALAAPQPPPGHADLRTLIQLVRDHDLIGAEEAATSLIHAGLQADIDDALRVCIFQ